VLDVKVGFATYDNPRDIGGASIWLQRLLPLLQVAGIELEVHVVALSGKPAVDCAFFKEHGIPVRWTPFQPHLPSAVRSFIRFLEQGQPDIYVPYTVVPAYYAAGCARSAGIPTVGVLLSDHSYYQGMMDEFVTGNPDFRVSAVVPCSTFLESQVSSTAAAVGVMVRRIACGIPISARTAELSRSAFRLIYVGRLVEEAKRISDVTNALCDITRDISNLEAWIVGDGDARPAVEAIISEKAMGARVKLLGRVPDVYDVLAQCHALVLLSDYEGLPTSVLEAMATGVVPICLDTRSGVREVIEHGVNGLIVKDRAADFFAAVKGLQSNPEKWRRLSLAARETVRRHFSAEECARQWIDLLEQLNRRKAGRGDFKAPRVLRLPPLDPRFYIDMRPPWKKTLIKQLRSIPTLYRIAKATLAVGRKARSQADRLF
jgi:colanic acid/amylovoran biosynthesis glycosyltransferase